MRFVGACVLATLMSSLALNDAARSEPAADLPVAQPAASGPAATEACGSFEEFVATACPLSWHGITLYGAYDIGIGWVSHGLPENGYNYEGESLVNRNAGGSRFVLAPNNLSQTGLGIKGRVQFMQDWYAVFNASTGFNPQSGQLANMAATNTTNNGLPRGAYSITGDGARAGQAFNDELYAGASSTRYGTLTFGRQRALGTDAVLAYDPANGAYSFSYIGYNGTTAGGGDTQDTRWDQAVKYRVAHGPVHFGLMYKFADGSGGCYSGDATWSAATCTPQQARNTAYGFDIGAEIERLSVDAVFQHYNQAISVLNPLLGAQSLTQPYQATVNSINTHPISGANIIDPNNTEYGIVTDNTAVMLAAKYTWNPFKVYFGYEHIQQFNPANPLGVGASAQGGYLLSGVENDNLDRPKLVQVAWTGVKYAVDARTDVTLSAYHQWQDNFKDPASCPPSAYRAACSGFLGEYSLYADHHFTKRFDAFAGVAYSMVSGGMAIAIPHGPGVPYLHDSNLAPAIGARFTF